VPGKMGTPRVSGSSDQMRRMQISVSGAGECAVHSALEKMGDSVVAAWFSTATATIAGNAAMFCWSEPDFANGCTGWAVFFCDVLQQVLFAQHPGVHAFWLGALERMHEAAGSRMDAPKRAVASITDTLILLSIDILLAECLPFVQWADNRLPAPSVKCVWSLISDFWSLN
jgi:hypothetical protein